MVCEMSDILHGAVTHNAALKFIVIMFSHLLKPQIYGDGVLVYLAIAGTHCACLQRDGQAELTRYILIWFINQA